MKLTHLPASSRKSVPWKNGGGETQEVAAFPPGASVDDFDWRISIATVSQPGAFSVFAGIDRHLTLLSGRLRLEIEGTPHELGSGDSIAFDGEAPAYGTPLTGTATDLNIMTRRGRFRADVTVMEPNAETPIEPGEGFVFAFARAQINDQQLQATDLLHFEAAEPEHLRLADGPALLIRFSRLLPVPSPDMP